MSASAERDSIVACLIVATVALNVSINPFAIEVIPFTILIPRPSRYAVTCVVISDDHVTTWVDVAMVPIVMVVCDDRRAAICDLSVATSAVVDASFASLADTLAVVDAVVDARAAMFISFVASLDSIDSNLPASS